jgi:uncharacterized repeat protein (TIGR01451 family)
MKTIDFFKITILKVGRSLQPKFRRQLFQRITALVTLLAFCQWSVEAAAPAAGVSIGNQASATYTDSSGVSRTATSNVAVTIVQPVASFTLTADNTRNVSPGGQVSFPHTLVNTGNGNDSFNLSVAQLTGDSFDLTALTIFGDGNGDGIPDNTTAISVTPSLASGATFKFVVVGNAPATQTGGQTAAIQVNASSVFTGTVTGSNTDTAIVSLNAVVTVTKSISANSGASPSGPITYTLTYNNTGNSTASALTLMDVIPAGMTYVAGSGRWSGAGATPLTDAALGDAAGILYDFGVTQAGRVTAVVSSVNPGQSGNLTFQVNVNSSVAPGSINNTATYSYDPGTGTPVGPFTSNGAVFAVNQVASVTLTGQTIASATQGSTVLFTNTVVNTGNGIDSFDITIEANTFPAGTTFSLFQGDTTTPLLDSNNNGIPGTGPIAPAGTYTVIVKATLSSTVSGGGPYNAPITATSSNDPTKAASTTDRLNTIVANTVDLTNDSPGPAAPGAGPGPEVLPVRNVAVNPGDTARFTFYVNNTSSVADSFNLSASSNSTFSVVTFAPGFTVTFRDGNNALITSTGVLLPGASKLFYADIFVPRGAPPGTFSGYVRAQSPTTGAQDIKHDSLTINTARSIRLEPNNTGQVSPGGSVVYSHFISNEGNVVEGDGVTSTVLTVIDNAVGFSSVVYWDKNNNGVLDATDPLIADLSTMIGGINGGSTAAGLDPGERARLFVKVFAPAGVSAGAVNATTLASTTTGGVGTLPPTVSVTDVTTVISGDVILLKEQALDANLDGVPDTAFTIQSITTGASPGKGIRYRITVTNNGSTPATSVVTHDSIPSFTTYDATVPMATTVGTIANTPANGGRGTFQVNIGTLNPGQSAVITFGVRIDQ